MYTHGHIYIYSMKISLLYRNEVQTSGGATKTIYSCKNNPWTSRSLPGRPKWESNLISYRARVSAEKFQQVQSSWINNILNHWDNAQMGRSASRSRREPFAVSQSPYGFFVCVYVLVHIHIYTFIYVYTWIYIYIRLDIHIYMYVRKLFVKRDVWAHVYYVKATHHQWCVHHM